MKHLILAALMTLPITALADHIDVIQFELQDGCSVSDYVAIKNDFNEQFGSQNGYRSEVLVAIQSHDLTSLYWVGRSESAEAFGKAWDQWRNDLSDPESAASKLWARFRACATNVGRRGYDVY
jgi:hypothetical protein